MDVSDCSLFIIFICKQAEHQEGNIRCNKGETVKTAQTGLLYLFFKARLWYIRSTVHLFPPLWKGKGSNGGWLQAISPPPLHICISPVLLTQISALQLLWSNIWFLLITTLHVYAAFQKNNHSGPYSKKKASSFPLCLTAEGIRVGRR